MAEKANIQVVEKWIEALNAHDAQQMEQYRAPGYMFEAPVFPGAVGVEQDTVFTQGLFEAFPDMRVDVKQTIAEGDLVVINMTVTGTHSGPMNMPNGQTIPATGKKISVSGSNSFELANGRILRNSLYYDQLGLMAQLGLAPGT
jgi:steroid delta-isomerase-like uncharacterized protein